MAKRQIVLDGEVADGITLACLKEHRGYLKKELKEYKKGQWLHPEDVVKNENLIRAMDVLIKYFGD